MEMTQMNSAARAFVEVFSWLAGFSQEKAQWKCVIIACGGQCATHCGMQTMPGSCATNWATPLQAFRSTIPYLVLGWLKLHGAMLVAVEAVKTPYLNAASLLQ